MLQLGHRQLDPAVYDSDKCEFGSNHLEGRLMARSQRYFSRQTVIILVTLALLFGLAAGAVAANTRLVDADANLEKAYVLVDAARADGIEEMEGRAYDRALRRAQRKIDRARQLIAEAVAIADAP